MTVLDTQFQIRAPLTIVSIRQQIPAKPPVQRSLLFGAIVLVLGLGGFVGWAATAPLSAATVAHGSLTAQSNRKTVQHEQGGIIADLLVGNGDHVDVGQPLLRLDDIEARGQVEMLDSQLASLQAEAARLVAERNGSIDVEFPNSIAVRWGEPKIAQILTGQRYIFLREREALATQVDILNRKILELKATITAYEAQLTAGLAQLELINEEMKSVEALYLKGLEKLPRLLALKRAAAQLEGMQGDFKGRMASARQEIAETEFQITGLRNNRQREVANQMRENENETVKVAEQIGIARAHQERREITSPQQGIVMNLRYFAAGAVVPAGGAVLDIVPGQDRLIAEVRIPSRDIDVVHEGLPTQLVMTSFTGRTTPRVDGRVTWVSADALTDEHTQQTYYLARVDLDSASVAKLGDVQLIPGMPVEGFIVSGSRTALDYLLEPLISSFRRAFRET
jgi:HlyD family secretion protein